MVNLVRYFSFASSFCKKNELKIAVNAAKQPVLIQPTKYVIRGVVNIQCSVESKVERRNNIIINLHARREDNDDKEIYKHEYPDITMNPYYWVF